MSAAVAAAIPTQAVEERGVFLTLPPVAVAPEAEITVRVGAHTVVVVPPPGYQLVQAGEGDPSRAHVTLGPVGRGGAGIVVRFEVPDGLDEGAVVDTHDGAPVHRTRFGLLWRSPAGVTILVSGGDLPSQLAVVGALRVVG